MLFVLLLIYFVRKIVAKNYNLYYVLHLNQRYYCFLKDLYYLENDALPEEYLDSDTIYKELWNKLTQFSKGPENSIESNVLLLYLLELNEFFNNEKILKELGDYDDLIANC